MNLPQPARHRDFIRSSTAHTRFHEHETQDRPPPGAFGADRHAPLRRIPHGPRRRPPPRNPESGRDPGFLIPIRFSGFGVAISIACGVAWGLRFWRRAGAPAVRRLGLRCAVSVSLKGGGCLAPLYAAAADNRLRARRNSSRKGGGGVHGDPDAAHGADRLISHRGEPQAQSVGAQTMRRSAVGEQVELAFLDAIFHLAALAIEVFAEAAGVILAGAERGDDETRLRLAVGPFGPGDDAARGACRRGPA